MGTRADFYVGRGETAKWIGSIAWDGYPEGITPHEGRNDKNRRTGWRKGRHLFDAKTEKAYLTRVEQFFKDRDDVSRPENGWPWPWDTSSTTDYAYAFEDGKVWACSFGHEWFDPLRPEPEDRGSKAAIFPDMTKAKRVTFGARSGLIVLGAK